MTPVSQEEALAELFDGNNVYVLVEGCTTFDGSEPIHEYDGIEYARIVSHEDLECTPDNLYV